MTGLLEVREKVKQFYSRYEAFILPVVKFLLAFVVLNALNGELGYMKQLDNIAVVLIVALLCSFLPTGALVLFAAVLSLAHMYALSMEVALVGVCVYLLMFLLFFRFSPGESLVVVLTPLFCAMKIPYVIPVAAGLLCSPAAAVSVGCGVGIHYLFETVKLNASNINTMGGDDTLAKIRLMVDGLISSREMLVVIAAFVATVLVVYLIRRMSIDYAWTIASVAGAMVDVVILLLGDLMYDINLSVVGVLAGALLAVVAAKVIEFFRFCVDYSRTEKVQFEDDEYYYYVKAVPKMTVSVSTKTVKKINSQQSGEAAAAVRSSAARAARNPQAGAPSRSVVTERTAVSRGAYGSGNRVRTENGDYRTGKSVTIGRTEAEGRKTEETADDYEELF